MCYPQDLCLGKVLPCRAPHLSSAAGIAHNPRSWNCTQPTQPLPPPRRFRTQPKHTWIIPNSRQLCDSALASPRGSPAGLSSSNNQVINWLPLQNHICSHWLRTKASGVNLSKHWAMDSYPGSSTFNLLSPLQLFIILQAFSKRGILPINHYHNLNNLQNNLFHDRIWLGLPFPQAFRYTNKLLTAHLHFNSIYSLYTTSNL